MLSLVTGGLSITRIPFRTSVSHKRQILQKILGEQQKNPKMENRLRRKTRTSVRQERVRLETSPAAVLKMSTSAHVRHGGGDVEEDRQGATVKTTRSESFKNSGVFNRKPLQSVGESKQPLVSATLFPYKNLPEQWCSDRDVTQREGVCVCVCVCDIRAPQGTLKPH